MDSATFCGVLPELRGELGHEPVEVLLPEVGVLGDLAHPLVEVLLDLVVLHEFGVGDLALLAIDLDLVLPGLLGLAHHLLGDGALGVDGGRGTFTARGDGGGCGGRGCGDELAIGRAVRRRRGSTGLLRRVLERLAVHAERGTTGRADGSLGRGHAERLDTALDVVEGLGGCVGGGSGGGCGRRGDGGGHGDSLLRAGELRERTAMALLVLARDERRRDEAMLVVFQFLGLAQTMCPVSGRPPLMTLSAGASMSGCMRLSRAARRPMRRYATRATRATARVMMK